MTAVLVFCLINICICNYLFAVRFMSITRSFGLVIVIIVFQTLQAREKFEEMATKLHVEEKLHKLMAPLEAIRRMSVSPRLVSTLHTMLGS